MINDRFPQLGLLYIPFIVPTMPMKYDECVIVSSSLDVFT